MKIVLIKNTLLMNSLTLELNSLNHDVILNKSIFTLTDFISFAFSDKDNFS